MISSFLTTHGGNGRIRQKIMGLGYKWDCSISWVHAWIWVSQVYINTLLCFGSADRPCIGAYMLPSLRNFLRFSHIFYCFGISTLFSVIILLFQMAPPVLNISWIKNLLKKLSDRPILKLFMAVTLNNPTCIQPVAVAI